MSVPAGLQASDPADQRGRKPDAHQDRHHEEDHRLPGQHRHGAGRHAASLGDAGHHGEDDEAEDVVYDGGTQDDLGGSVLKTTEVGQHARRDADARRGERRPYEHGEQRRVTKPVHDAVADGERHHHAHQRHEGGLKTRAQQIVDVGLQTHLEEQDQARRVRPARAAPPTREQAPGSPAR